MPMGVLVELYDEVSGHPHSPALKISLPQSEVYNFLITSSAQALPPPLFLPSFKSSLSLLVTQSSKSSFSPPLFTPSLKSSSSLLVQTSLKSSHSLLLLLLQVNHPVPLHQPFSSSPSVDSAPMLQCLEPPGLQLCRGVMIPWLRLCPPSPLLHLGLSTSPSGSPPWSVVTLPPPQTSGPLAAPRSPTPLA